MELRPYQRDAIDRARDLINGGKRKVCLVAPCGAGKGLILATLMESARQRGKRVLAIVHRRELVEDLAERVERMGFRPGVVLPGHDPRPERSVQVGSVQTLARRDLPPADLLLVDECHHSTASTWKDLIDAYPRAAVVGTTATPCRLGGAPLGDVFQALVEVVKPADLVQDGFLVPVTGYAFDAPDLRGVRRASGDYEPEEIARLMGGPKLRGSIVESYLQRARGTRAICFAVNVAHSRQIAADFVRAGVQAEHVDGETPRALRRIIFERFRSGSTRVLCNVGLFTEGVDLPAIETVILARPTLSLSLALQMIGRGRRPIPCACGLIPHWRDSACRCGRPIPKKATRVHDHAGVVLQHGLPDEPRVWSLDGDYRVGTGDKGAKGDESKAIRVCRSCLSIYLADEPQCPMCGKKNPAPKKLVRNGNGVAIPLASLESVNRPIDASEQVRRRFFWFLLGLERDRGYKRGYAEVRFHGRFHMWAPSKAWRERFERGEPADPPPAQVAPEGATHA